MATTSNKPASKPAARKPRASKPAAAVTPDAVNVKPDTASKPATSNPRRVKPAAASKPAGTVVSAAANASAASKPGEIPAVITADNVDAVLADASIPAAVRKALAAAFKPDASAAPKRGATASAKRAPSAAPKRSSGGEGRARRDADAAAAAERRRDTRVRDGLIICRYVDALAAGSTGDTIRNAVCPKFKPALTFGQVNTVLYVWKRDLRRVSGVPEADVPGPRNVDAAKRYAKRLNTKAGMADMLTLMGTRPEDLQDVAARVTADR